MFRQKSITLLSTPVALLLKTFNEVYPCAQYSVGKMLDQQWSNVCF